MSALARTTKCDCYTRAANEDYINVGLRTRTKYTYDGFGNITSVSTTVTDKDSASPYVNQTWTTTTTNTTDVDTTNWCLGLFTQIQTAYSASNDSPPVTRTQQFTPDTAHCRNTQVVTEPNSSTYKVTESFGFDSFGNVKSDTVTGINMTARVTSASWGATGQFVTVITDAAGATTQLGYDSRFGLPSSQTDANGLTTTWQYDGFGRQILEKRPDGTSTSSVWQTPLSCAPITTCGLMRNVVNTDQLDTAGHTLSSVNTVLDPLDRPYQVEHPTQTGGASYVLTTYDALGRVASKTAPFIYGATQYSTTFSYDVLNRQTLAQSPISAGNSTLQSTSTQYQGDTTTTTDANTNVKTLVSDPLRRLRRVQDATGYVVIRSYDAAGSLTGVTDSASNTLLSATYQYGIAPFKVTATDSDLGAWSYSFDALGDQVGWQDAKGQHFSAAYDALSRITDRYEPDLYTHWSWGTGSFNGTATANRGQLQAVCTGVGSNPTACSSTGYAESETYDSLDRLSQRAIQIPGDATYTYTWQYNATTGYTNTLTYPTTPTGAPLQVQYGYANGFLQSITDVSASPKVTLWTANAVDAADRWTQETLGNHVVVNHTIDAVTGRLNSITAGLNGGTALQNNSYLFDSVGNLTQRQDNNAGVTENAYYDSLNRLTHTVGDASVVMSYDSVGRLSGWGASGVASNSTDYTTAQTPCTYYSNAQVHAVRKDTIGSHFTINCYDANGNMILEQDNYSPNHQSTTTWTSYNQPLNLSGLSQFAYDHNHQRWQQIANWGSSTETTEYIGGLLEKVSNASGTSYRHYVPAGSTQVVYNRWVGGTTAVNYITQDHLGSSAVVTDPTGALVVKETFSAFGWRENTSAEQTTIGNISRHGFTGQEGLDNPGVWAVNMNGRVYQPSGSYFYAPDPSLPDPTDTRSYNRYAYVNYNPLTLIDPTGFDDCDPAELCFEVVGHRDSDQAEPQLPDFGGARPLVPQQPEPVAVAPEIVVKAARPQSPCYAPFSGGDSFASQYFARVANLAADIADSFSGQLDLGPQISGSLNLFGFQPKFTAGFFNGNVSLTGAGNLSISVQSPTPGNIAYGEVSLAFGPVKVGQGSSSVTEGSSTRNGSFTQNNQGFSFPGTVRASDSGFGKLSANFQVGIGLKVQFDALSALKGLGCALSK